MTGINPNGLRITIPRSHLLRDVVVVTLLAIILGAFVTQIASRPSARESAPSAAIATSIHEPVA